MTTTENPPAATAGAGTWRLNVLGPVELCYDGDPVAVAGPTRTLLALLARSPCEEISTASIVAGMWGSEAPEDSEKEVASHVSRLRKALTAVAPNVDPTSVVVTMQAGYILAIQPSNADILSFERLSADGQRALAVGQPDLALARLDAALALWRGRAYEDFGEHAFVRAEAARLEELRLAAVESRVDALLAISAPIAPPDLVTQLQTLLAEHWHRERLWAQLMTALFRLGRRGDALAACRRAQEVLARNLRVQAGPQLRAVEQAVIDTDSSLYGTPLRPSTVPVALATTIPACLGRAEEVAWLCAALDLAATRRAQARLVVGSPGMGKSRLVAEVAQRAAEHGVVIRHWRGDASGIETLVAESDRLSLVVVEDLDQASHEDVARVANFVRAAMTRPVVTLVTCRDPVRVGDLQSVPKLVLTGLDDAAVAEIVRGYAPAVADATAVSAMINTGGVPARVHRAASEWAFGRAGRRIDRAVADAAEPRRALAALHEEVVAGATELAHVRAKARLLRPTSRSTGCPYPGLRSFQPADAELFHGRQRVIAELLARTVEAPLLAIVGEAGTGKSSLVRAGLLPSIAAGVLPDSTRWRQVVVTPTSVESLAEFLAVPSPVREPAPPAADETAADETAADETAADETTADGAAADGAAAHDEPAVDDTRMRTLLVVDQFEEAFTVLDAEHRDAFLADVADAARAADTAGVIVAIRAEFFPECARHAAIAHLVSANVALVPPMTPTERRRAIEAPAAAVGASVQPDLAAALAQADGGLAQLAATLRCLWDKRSGTTLTVASWTDRSLDGAIETLAEGGFAALTSAATREAARTMLLELVSVREDHPAVRRRANLTELVTHAGPAGLAALQALADGGLVTVSADVDAVELAHDVLLTGWPRLREWIEERAAEHGLRSHLRRAAQAWAAGGRNAAGLYRGARLVTVLDWAERHETELTADEREFLAAAHRVVTAAETRRRRRSILLWKWLAATIAVAVLAVAVAAVAVTMQLRSSSAAQRAGAAQLAALAGAEPDLREAILLAVAAARLDADRTDAVRAVLERAPQLLAAVGRGVTSVSVSPDGGTLAAGEAGGAVLLLRPSTLSGVGRLEYPGHAPVNGLTFTRDGRRLVSWGGSRTPVAASAEPASIVIWDVAAKRAEGGAFGQVWPDAGGGLLADGVTLLLAQHGQDPAAASTPITWSIESRTPSTAYQLPSSGVDSLVLSADGRVVVLGTRQGAVVVEPGTGATRTLGKVANPLAVSPDGRMLLASDGADVAIWDLDTGGLRAAAHGKAQILGADWAPAGDVFATVDADGAVIVWDAATARATRTITGHRLATSLVRFSTDGRSLFTAGDGGSLFAWDLTGTRGVSTQLAAGPADIVSIACRLVGRDMSPDEWRRFLPDRSFVHVCPT